MPSEAAEVWYQHFVTSYNLKHNCDVNYNIAAGIKRQADAGSVKHQKLMAGPLGKNIKFVLLQGGPFGTVTQLGVQKKPPRLLTDQQLLTLWIQDWSIIDDDGVLPVSCVQEFYDKHLEFYRWIHS